MQYDRELSLSEVDLTSWEQGGVVREESFKEVFQRDVCHAPHFSRVWSTLTGCMDVGICEDGSRGLPFLFSRMGQVKINENEILHPEHQTVSNFNLVLLQGTYEVHCE